jgi:hypothetical protein
MGGPVEEWVCVKTCFHGSIKLKPFFIAENSPLDSFYFQPFIHQLFVGSAANKYFDP